MSYNISTALVKQFHDNFELTPQQTSTLLRRTVLEEKIKGKEALFDQVGVSHAVEMLERHGDTPMVNIPHSRRLLRLRDFSWGEMISSEDKLKMLGEPTNEYLQSGIAAMNRVIDTLIVDAALGTALTGANGTTVTNPQTALAVGSGAAARFTLDKILAAKKQLDIGNAPANDRYFVVTSTQMDDLLKIEKLTSADYNTVRGLVDGSIDSFAGFKFITINDSRDATSTNSILSKSGNNRRCFAFQKNGIKLGLGEEIKTSISIRNDKNDDKQLLIKMSANATRMHEGLVLEVPCAE
jgi:hypothetical protein